MMKTKSQKAEREKRKPSDYLILSGLAITYSSGGFSSIPLIIAIGILGLALLAVGAVLDNAE